MSVKEQILKAISHMDDQRQLNELLEYVRKLNSDADKGSNMKKILTLAGTISDEEAARMKKIIDEEFNTIEGEW